MPLVRITLRKGKSPEFVQAVADAVHAALTGEANVPVDDRFQIIEEVEPRHIIAHQTYGGVQRSADLVIVQVTLNQGRTVEVKRALYADMARRLGQAGLRPDDLLVSLVEVTKENWSFGNGLATYA